MVKYSDLESNDELPIEARIKHLEREAAFVRDHVKQTQLNICVLTVLACALTVAIAVLLSIHK